MKNLNYDVKSIKLEIDETKNYGDIKKIYLEVENVKLVSDIDINVENIEIDVSSSEKVLQMKHIQRNSLMKNNPLMDKKARIIHQYKKIHKAR